MRDLDDWLRQHRRRRRADNEQELRRSWADSRPFWERWGLRLDLDDVGFTLLCLAAILLSSAIILLMYDLYNR